MRRRPIPPTPDPKHCRHDEGIFLATIPYVDRPAINGTIYDVYFVPGVDPGRKGSFILRYCNYRLDYFSQPEERVVIRAATDGEWHGYKKAVDIARDRGLLAAPVPAST